MPKDQLSEEILVTIQAGFSKILCDYLETISPILLQRGLTKEDIANMQELLSKAIKLEITVPVTIRELIEWGKLPG